MLTKQDKPLWIFISVVLTFAAHSDGHTGAEWGPNYMVLLEILQVPERLYEWAKDRKKL